jgi:hypothetical protein
MEKLVFSRMNLSDVRVIITITRVPVKDLLCQTVMGRIIVLECPLSKVCGRLSLRPVVPDIKWCYFSSIRL